MLYVYFMFCHMCSMLVVCVGVFFMRIYLQILLIVSYKCWLEVWNIS